MDSFTGNTKSNDVPKMLTVVLYIELFIALALAVHGFIFSSGAFFRGAIVLFEGVPATVILVALYIAFKSSSLNRKKNIAIVCGSYFLLFSVFSFMILYSTNSDKAFYEKLDKKVQLGMTYDQVKAIANGREGKCRDIIEKTKSHKECFWNDASYSSSGVLVGIGKYSMTITFDFNGKVTNKHLQDNG